MAKSISELLFPAQPKQRVLDELGRVESLLDEIAIFIFGKLDKPKLITAVHANDTEYLNSFQKELCAKSLRDIELAKGLIINWDDMVGAYELIAKVNFNRGVLLEEYFKSQQAKENSRIGGGNKLGYEGPIKQYVRRACEQLCLDELPVKQAAAIIAKLFENSEELEIYRAGEICPIEVIEYDRDTGTLFYFDRRAPDKQKKPVDDKRLRKLITEIREPKKSE